MDLKTIEGRASLGDADVTLTFDNKFVTPPAKKAVSPRIIPYHQVLEVDFLAPTKWKAGHLRIITRKDQPRLTPFDDTYTVQFGAGRRISEAVDFVANLQAAVDAVEYAVPAGPAEIVQQRPSVTFKELAQDIKKFGAAMDDAKKNNGKFRGLSLHGRTLSKGQKSWAANECEISIDVGANVSGRTTATRVAAGALLAGSTGALIGSISQKDRSAVYLTVITPGETIVEKVAGPDEIKAREFAAKVKRAALLQSRETAEARQIEAVQDTPVEAPLLPDIPAGWYPRGDVQQYWDGNGWTSHTAPLG